MPFTLPPDAYDALVALPTRIIEFGTGGIAIYDPQALDRHQVGYAVDASGAVLGGDWQPQWVVIGEDLALGDPIIVDTGAPGCPVLTAIHGQGTWDPTTIAATVQAFAQCLQEFATLAQGRESPAAREQSEVSDNARDQYLAQIAALSGLEEVPDFWEALLES